MPGAHLPNVLAARYASGPMADIWSPERKVVLERELWVAVMRAQHDLGLDLPLDVIDDHVAVIDKVDLASIEARERVTRHDVKARIEEFSALAGHERIHAGMTSRDLTENVEQLQVRAALALVRDRMVDAPWLAWPSGPPSTPPSSWPAAATTCRPRPPRWASGSPTPARSCSRRCVRVEELLARYPAARHEGPGRHPAGHARPARLGGAGRRARGGGGQPPRLRGHPHQRRPGVPALARPRRRRRAGAGGLRAGQPGHHHPPDGRPRAGHRGVPARPGRARRRCPTR